MIINFLGYHLDLHISHSDISIAHRHDILSERKKYGRNYIPAIYCKFLNRTALEVLKRKHWLKNKKKHLGQKIAVKENLTYYRRTLWERVQEELNGYRYKWTKHGEIYLRKDSYGNRIPIENHLKLDWLIRGQSNTCEDTCPSTTNANLGEHFTRSTHP